MLWCMEFLFIYVLTIYILTSIYFSRFLQTVSFFKICQNTTIYNIFTKQRANCKTDKRLLRYWVALRPFMSETRRNIYIVKIYNFSSKQSSSFFFLYFLHFFNHYTLWLKKRTILIFVTNLILVYYPMPYYYLNIYYYSYYVIYFDRRLKLLYKKLSENNNCPVYI